MSKRKYTDREARNAFDHFVTACMDNVADRFPTRDSLAGGMALLAMVAYRQYPELFDALDLPDAPSFRSARAALAHIVEAHLDEPATAPLLED